MVKQRSLYKVLLHSTLILSFSLQQEISAMVKQNCFYEVLGILISSISLHREISAMMKQKCFYKVLGTLIFSISLQQEISAIVKQNCLYKVLLHRNSDIFHFFATRNQCNSETEMSS